FIKNGGYSINSPDSCIKIVPIPDCPDSSFKGYCVKDIPCLGAMSVIASTTFSNGTYLLLKKGLFASFKGCLISFCTFAIATVIFLIDSDLSILKTPFLKFNRNLYTFYHQLNMHFVRVCYLVFRLLNTLYYN